MFAVAHVEAIPDHLRGYLSRYLQEIRTGIYVGTVTSRVIDELWRRITETATVGSAILVVSDPTIETGFDVRLHGVRTHRIVDLDGIKVPVERPRGAK